MLPVGSGAEPARPAPSVDVPATGPRASAASRYHGEWQSGPIREKRRGGPVGPPRVASAVGRRRQPSLSRLRRPTMPNAAPTPSRTSATTTRTIVCAPVTGRPPPPPPSSWLVSIGTVVVVVSSGTVVLCSIGTVVDVECVDGEGTAGGGPLPYLWGASEPG